MSDTNENQKNTSEEISPEKQPTHIWLIPRTNWQVMSDGVAGQAFYVKPYKPNTTVEYVRADRVRILENALAYYQSFEMEDTENALRRIKSSFNDTGATADKALDEYYGKSSSASQRSIIFTDMSKAITEEMEKTNEKI